MAKRFELVDGVLMYTKVSPPVRVPRSREEVNSILKQFHDNQGHYGLGTCQKEISKHFYWNTMSRDLARWINSCHFCLNRTKRRWLRCSISSCTNCCGPVERGLGLTFYNFPFKNATLMSQWIKATGRQHWHPRLWSSVCSLHFTEECFDHSEEKATLRPDAVPTLLVHSDSATQRSVMEEENGNQEKAFFAKYDAVERYLCSQTYPPGLTYVEKNTFRRFCKKFTIRDEQLHLVKGARLHLVLRNRQQVEDALKEFHDELNHLGVSKCFRLLNERYFWKTMRADVVQWINSCLLCNRKQRKKPEPEESETQQVELRSHRLIDNHSDSAQDDEDVEVCDEGSGGDRKGINETQTPEMISDQTTTTNHESQKPETSPNPTSTIPILFIHLKPRTPLGLQNWTLTTPDVLNNQNQKNSLQETEPSLPEGITRPQTFIKPSSEVTEEPQTHQETSQPRTQKTQMQSHTSTQRGSSSSSSQRPMKRKRNLEVETPAKRNPSHGLEPVVSPSNKPWPVFTVAGSPQTETAKHPLVVNSAVPHPRPRRIEARTIIQQCSRAKVQIRPAVDGADARWAKIEEGMVVFVCFFNGATEDVTNEMANTLMTTKFFRQGTASPVSVLDLPGSVLLVPQESLQAEPGPRRRMRYEGGCEPWWAAQLFTGLVSACRDLMKASQKCTRAGVKVEEGVYGQRQEMVLNSVDPLTHLLEF
uniref:D-aminoacyl-tRNA deacylase n=2 Tax=Sphaeramia orbicularis TaxID=375764 RepID=A0A673BFG6_9TELE